MDKIDKKKRKPAWAQGRVVVVTKRKLPALRNPERYCTCQEAAAAMGRELRAVRHYVRNGKLKSILHQGVRPVRLIVKQSLTAFMASDAYRLGTKMVEARRAK